jgi:hypothetical protein
MLMDACHTLAGLDAHGYVTDLGATSRGFAECMPHIRSDPTWVGCCAGANNISSDPKRHGMGSELYIVYILFIGIKYKINILFIGIKYGI